MKDYSLKINGRNYDVQIDSINDASTLAHVKVNGTEYEVEIGGIKGAVVSKPHVAPVPKAATGVKVTPSTPVGQPRQVAAPASGYAVKCPLPGTVLSVNVAVGDTVTRGKTLLVLEAMKMENNIDADRDGVVKQILVQQGATVMEGDQLVIIE